MSSIRKRKRARKACLPCHQRKRKCNGEYPCGTCSTYEYDCKYADENPTEAAASGEPAPPVKRSSHDISHSSASQTTVTVASRSPDSRPQVVASPIMTSTPSTTSPATIAGIFDDRKSRFTGASAAMAFPHILGVALGSDSPPKVSSFAYNFGIRPEEASHAYAFLGNLITEGDLNTYSAVYFAIMGAIGDYMDPRIYAQRCRDYYGSSGTNSIIFGAIAAGVAAFGSFLSPSRHPCEPELVQFAKAILDDPALMRMLDVDHIIAWALRVFYLRGTTRPNNAWVASCTAMHLIEAIGLHEEANILRMASMAGAAALGHDADRLRRIFWISWSGHNLLSYEYDRSSVRFGAVTVQPIIPIAGSVADQFVQIAQIIPAPNSPFQLDVQPPTPREELFERIKAVDKIHSTHPFLVVTKADLAFCFYRRIYQMKMGISDEIIQLVIKFGDAAVKEAETLADQGRLFWNAIGSAFQYACILLALDTPLASARIPIAFKGLENLVKAADTGLTRQALSMARYLLNLNMAKKQKELAQLQAVEESFMALQPEPEVDANPFMSDIGLGDLWDQFLVDPYLSMLGPDLQF